MRMRSFYFFYRDEIHKYEGFYMYPNIYIYHNETHYRTFFFFFGEEPIIELDINTITFVKIK